VKMEKLLGVVHGNESICGYVYSVEEAFNVLRAYELQDHSRFVCTKRPRKFGKKGT